MTVRDKDNDVADAFLIPLSAASAELKEPSQLPQKTLMEAVKLKPRHGHSRSSSDTSNQSSSFDNERPSQDDDDIDNTPATSYGGFLSSHSEASAGPKSDSSHLSNINLLSSARSVASDDPSRMDELNEEVEALFDKFLPDFQAQQDETGKTQHGAEPTLLSRNLPPFYLSLRGRGITL